MFSAVEADLSGWGWMWLISKVSNPITWHVKRCQQFDCVRRWVLCLVCVLFAVRDVVWCLRILVFRSGGERFEDVWQWLKMVVIARMLNINQF